MDLVGLQAIKKNLLEVLNMIDDAIEAEMKAAGPSPPPHPLDLARLQREHGMQSDETKRD